MKFLKIGEFGCQFYNDDIDNRQKEYDVNISDTLAGFPSATNSYPKCQTQSLKFLFVLFYETGSLGSIGWPGTLYVDQAGLECIDIHVPLPPAYQV